MNLVYVIYGEKGDPYTALLRAVTLLAVVTEGNVYQENINCVLNKGHAMDVSMAKTGNREELFIIQNKLFCVCFC